MTIPEIDKDFLRKQLPDFARQTADYHNEKIGKIAYKEFSGYFGSFAQRDGKSNMLRLRCSAGRITVAKLAFIAEMIRKYNISRIHFTTGQTIQLHDLSAKAAAEILEQCLDADIIPFGCGGDYPGNVLCSPLSGVEREEYFDVLPYAEAAAQYLVAAIPDGKLPRKFKTGFSNSPQNLTHATMRDLGFAARPDGRFDVYSAGGLGPAPCIGIKMAEAVAPEKILYHIKAMLATFREYGTYTQRSKSRTRYLPELLGGKAAYKAAYSERLLQALQEGGLDLQLEILAARHTDGLPVFFEERHQIGLGAQWPQDEKVAELARLVRPKRLVGLFAGLHSLTNSVLVGFAMTARNLLHGLGWSPVQIRGNSPQVLLHTYAIDAHVRCDGHWRTVLTGFFLRAQFGLSGFVRHGCRIGRALCHLCLPVGLCRRFEHRRRDCCSGLQLGRH